MVDSLQYCIFLFIKCIFPCQKGGLKVKSFYMWNLWNEELLNFNMVDWRQHHNLVLVVNPQGSYKVWRCQWELVGPGENPASRGICDSSHFYTQPWWGLGPILLLCCLEGLLGKNLGKEAVVAHFPFCHLPLCVSWASLQGLAIPSGRAVRNPISPCLVVWVGSTLWGGLSH